MGGGGGGGGGGGVARKNEGRKEVLFLALSPIPDVLSSL